MSQHQLILPLSLPDDETFASFYPGKNQALLAAIQSLLSQQNPNYIYIWSGQSAGRSHLLHAACSTLHQQGERVSYIPLDSHEQLVPYILEGMEDLALVCLDNIENIAGRPDWEQAIFNLYNRMREQSQTRLLITANAPPRQLNIQLPDLASRLDWGQIYRLHPLSDEDKLLALQRRAHLRGFELSEEVGQFLFKRWDRDLRALFTALNKLDQASISAQRKLTIPFVKTILSL